MDFKAHLENAWHLTLRYIVSLIILTLAADAIAFISFGILGPVIWAGYFQAIIYLVRNSREPRIQDLFSEMALFIPLLVFGIIVVIVLLIGFSIFFLPGIVMTCVVSFVCLYMIPLMTDKNYGLMDAIKKSFKIVTGDKMVEHIVVTILFVGISAIGSSVAIGWLFTQPFASVFLALVYEETVNGVLPPDAGQRKPSSPKETSFSDKLKQK